MFAIPAMGQFKELCNSDVYAWNSAVLKYKKYKKYINESA